MDANSGNKHDCKCLPSTSICTNNAETLTVEPIHASSRLSTAILGNQGNSKVSLRFHSAGDVHGGITRQLSGGVPFSHTFGNYSEVRLARALQNAVNNHEWRVAERLVPYMSDLRRLNDGLCSVLDSIWFLKGQHEIDGAIRLMERLVEAGARDFSRGSLRTSFLAACVSACQSCARSLSDTVSVIAERLRERLLECNDEEVVKSEAASKVQRFTEWALKCIGSHCRRRGRGGTREAAQNGMLRSSAVESHLQLVAFRRFMELSGDRLTAKDCTEAFDAACFPLTLFSSGDPGWASGIAATVIQGLLQMLMEFGANNINQCFLEAARFGSTELVRMLLQIARRNSVDLDVDLALRFASRYSKITTVECLVMDGNANSFLGPLMRASERGCMEIVQWFVMHGCKEMELCLALTAALSNSHIDIVIFLLKHVPKHSLFTLSEEIMTAAGERSSKALQGIAYLLEINFLDDSEATYGVADRIANSDDEGVVPELKAFLKREWSEEAFRRGVSIGREHYFNVVRAISRGSSSLCLIDMPLQLQVAVAYLPLYNECVATNGELLPQFLRGQLVEAASRLSTLSAEELSMKSTCKQSLLSILESRLPSFFTEVALKVKHS